MANRSEPVGPGRNRICTSCQIYVASVFCECTGFRVFLCSKCIGSHTTEKNPDLMHLLIPTALDVSDVEAFRLRSQTFVSGKKELEQNLRDIDLCCEDFTASINLQIEKMVEYRDRLVGILQALKVRLNAEVAEAVAEVRSSLSQDRVDFRCKYSPFLRDYQPGGLTIFKYRIDTSGLERLMQKTLKIEYSDPARDRDSQVNDPLLRLNQLQITDSKKLVLLEENQVKLLNLQSKSWGRPTRLSRAILFDRDSRYTPVDESRLFCCGSSRSSHEAFIVNWDSGAVENLPPLEIGRESPGVLSHDNSVFVFGTYHKSELDKAVEALQLSTRAWVRLQDMTAGRSGFTPSVHHNKAYLCCDEDTSIDVFNLRTLSFLPALPRAKGANYGAVTLVMGDEMVIITSQSSAIINLRTRAINTTAHEFSSIIPASTPVVFKRKVYWMNWDGKCFQASGSSFEVVQEVRV